MTTSDRPRLQPPHRELHIPVPTTSFTIDHETGGVLVPPGVDPLRTPELTYRLVTIPDAPIGLDDLPVTDAPTDTCTCHCWANHPNLAGRCEAASHPGLQIDDQPVCHGCWAAAHTPGSHSRGHGSTIARVDELGAWADNRALRPLPDWEFLGYTTEDDLDTAISPLEGP